MTETSLVLVHLIQHDPKLSLEMARRCYKLAAQETCPVLSQGYVQIADMLLDSARKNATGYILVKVK